MVHAETLPTCASLSIARAFGRVVVLFVAFVLTAGCVSSTGAPGGAVGRTLTHLLAQCGAADAYELRVIPDGRSARYIALGRDGVILAEITIATKHDGSLPSLLEVQTKTVLVHFCTMFSSEVQVTCTPGRGENAMPPICNADESRRLMFVAQMTEALEAVDGSSRVSSDRRRHAYSMVGP